MNRISQILRRCILTAVIAGGISLTCTAAETTSLDIHLDSPTEYQIFQRVIRPDHSTSVTAGQPAKDGERSSAVPSPLPLVAPVQTGGRGEGQGEVRVSGDAATIGEGKIIIAGRILPETKGALPVDALEARLTGTPAVGDLPSDWQQLPFDPRVSAFRDELVAPAGGWYSLQVRALRQGVPVLTNTIDHVGVGEIFVIAGQSNSANYGEHLNRTQTGLVAAFNGTNWQLAADPEPGAGGKKGSFMPPFGDAMAEQFHVPIGIVAMGIGSTSVREWLPGGVPFSKLPPLTRNVVTVAPGQWESSGKIFDNFTARMKQLGANGFRAVLWHQGESDAKQADSERTLPGDLYRKYLEQLISDSRKEIGWSAPWFVATVSYHSPTDTGSPDIRAAQKGVCDDGFALPGPDTDTLTGPMREKNGAGIHLSAAGLKAHAQLWVEKVAPWLQQELAAANDSKQ